MFKDKSGSPLPTAEELVDEAWTSHVNVLKRIQVAGESSIDPKAEYGSVPNIALEVLDHLGVDRLLVCRKSNGYFWLPIQVKTSDNGRTIGVMSSFGAILDEKVSAKLSDGMLAMLKEHLRKHPSVECVLFVSVPINLSQTKRKKILKLIWKETIKLVRMKLAKLKYKSS